MPFMNALAPLAVLVVMVLAPQRPARDVRPTAVAASSSLRGRVVTDAGVPIRKARVALKIEGQDAGWPVFTGPDGRFQFSSLPAGRYTVTASKAGYVTTRFGARQPLEPAVPLTLSAGEVLDNVEIRLARGAAINGRIVDENGDPVIDAPVSAERLVRAGSMVNAVALKSTTTDDLGDYRLPELPAGSYVVDSDIGGDFRRTMGTIAMTGRADAASILVFRRGASVDRIFYPTALTAAQAQVISLQPGQELTSIDFAIRPMTMPHVNIAITDPTSTVSQVRYELVPDGRPGDAMSPSGVIGVGEPLSLPAFPGGWTLLVDGGSAGAAESHFTVTDADAGVSIALRPLLTISGRILVDGRASDAGGRITVETVPRGSPLRGGMLSQAARATPDGTFTVAAVQGPIELRLRNAPPGWSLETLAIGGRVLPDTWIDLTRGEAMADVTVRVSTRPTDLSGTVSTTSGPLTPADSVVVFPVDPARLDNPDRWARWIKPDPHGRFELRDLPEGDYGVVALRDVDDATWATRQFLDSVRSMALTVRLIAGETTKVSLTVRPAP